MLVDGVRRLLRDPARRGDSTTDPRRRNFTGHQSRRRRGVGAQEALRRCFTADCQDSSDRRRGGRSRKRHLPSHHPQSFSAIDGDKVGVPKFWQTGGGSFGCLRSHLSILERAIQDDVQSILVLEDDAVFAPTFRRDLESFFEKVPADWQCLMLGGQHVNSQPIPVVPGVVRAGGGGGIQRTHCYGLRGYEPMKALYKAWSNAAVHCDWVMGPCMAQYNTYAPDPFIVGQAMGRSDISGAQNPTKFWRPPNGDELVIILHAPREVMEGLREKGWHGGHSRDSATGIDTGLRDLFADSSLSSEARQAKLKDWIQMIQWEVASMVEPAICTIWHPKVSADMVRPLTRGKVVEISASSVEDALRQLPPDLHQPVSRTIKVVLLRASRKVMEALRERGWHTGHWRDEITGMDNGLRRLFASTNDPVTIKSGLCEIATVLHDEAGKNPNGIATLWHERITPDMLNIEGIEAIEIHANTPAEAVAKLDQSRHAKAA